ncbi:hypothetical protein L1887_20615 [Cichorium endivia]|nr:hypothetical protein L1887_20615 [Cichorium endivia]
MLHTKSEYDITSLVPSSPLRSPKRPIYFVQSPSRDSQAGDKSSSIQATPNFRIDFPGFSGHIPGGKFIGKGTIKAGQPECNVIVEEGKYDEYNDEKRLTRVLMALLSFIVLFNVLCLIIWGVSRPFKPECEIW